MYLKKYNYSKVTDQQFIDWFKKAGFGNDGSVTRIPIENVNVITIMNYNILMEIDSKSNLITCKDVKTMKTVFPEHEIEIMEEIFNTQWINPKIKMPEPFVEIIGKFGSLKNISSICKCTLEVFETNIDDGHYFDNYANIIAFNDCLGWMSTNNAIL